MESLPKEIQNHIFYYWAEHPAATVIRDYFQTRCDDCGEGKARWYDSPCPKGFFCKSCYQERACVRCGRATENYHLCVACRRIPRRRELCLICRRPTGVEGAILCWTCNARYADEDDDED